MLMPTKGSPYLWIIKQPEKRYAIINNFKHKSMGRSAVKLFSSDFNPEDMRISAIKYIKSINYTEELNEILLTVKNLEHSRLLSESLYVYASINPLNIQFKNKLKDLLSQSDEKESNTVKILKGIQNFTINYKPSGLGNGKIIMETSEISKNLLDSLFKLNVFPYVYSHQYNPRDQWRGVDIMFGSQSKNWLEKFGSIKDFLSWGAYWNYLEDIANKGEIEKFKIMMPRLSNQYFAFGSRVDQPLPVYINIELNKLSELVVQRKSKNGNKIFNLTKNNASKIYIIPSNDNVDRGIKVEWEDENKKTKYGFLKKFVGNKIKMIPTIGSYNFI